ncbi:hypothetical protein BTR14_05045 [Rhizobium rhizosphaerae]|uniref:DUF2442 domain-containing protein n=1 Tax=Xaviernesmea rhizosphaerae TaxID=1672749 RepID=A0ABX3PFV6_9HYPH|nr:DUF2442 domain-containing protein [Xaviernesmea rhizosphaerae]OQP87312.1 hypothetical protein BTR14_05045 [Xaviernesmea rhizosphaerae]
MEISDRDFAAAVQRGQKARSDFVAASARYDAGAHALVVVLSNGVFVGFPVERLEGLQGADAAQLAHVRVEAGGLGLHWPDLDADLYVPALMEGIFGSRTWMAAQLGASGGQARSEAKASAAKRNGARGGRPRRASEG